MQENTAMVPLGDKERQEQKENIKGCKKDCSPGEGGLLSPVEFLGPSKVLHQEWCDRQKIVHEARDTGDGERKGRGGMGTPLSSEVR